MMGFILTPPEHEHTAMIHEASQWLASVKVRQIPTDIILELKQRFGLKTEEAIQATCEAFKVSNRHRINFEDAVDWLVARPDGFSRDKFDELTGRFGLGLDQAIEALKLASAELKRKIAELSQ